MKKTALVLALATALSACDKKDEAEAKTEDGKVEVAATESTSKTEFKDMYEKAAYSIGVNFSNQMKQNFDSLKDYGVTINQDLVIQGMKDGFAGTAQFNEQEIVANMHEFQNSLNEKMQAHQAKLDEEAKKKAEESKAAGDAFRAEYAKKEGVQTTSSGLMYRVITAGGNDEKPSAEDSVKVHYKGTFINGEEFDSSFSRNEPTSFPLGGVIKGWTEGLQFMAVGDKFEFVIPPEIGYGENDRGSIPGNSTLVFEIELLEINPEDK